MSETLETPTATASGVDSTSTISPIPDDVPAHHASPVVAFIIGLSIILLASILNAGGLNITKLDHVRTSAIPKASRRKDWLRPLWLLGMILYILSQLIGSTLALQYLRAEYVAPLGSTSLIFNFLFASLLVGTPVTSTDIYGTIIVIVGVVGIVLFGSINSGIESEMDLARLKGLWGRANWLLYFIVMSITLILVYIFTSQLESILSSRADISAEPFSGQAGRGALPTAGTSWRRRVANAYRNAMDWVKEKLEAWTAAKDDKTIAWTLGIGWACCGGGLAGGCLVFAKATVKMISGSLSHENTGNQFVHVASFATFLFLALTAIFQIICLNRGLKAYDSTLVVPVFYGVYTGTGFLNSLIFNNEVDKYKSWVLFLIFVSILVLISGVVLLTHKKPETKPKTLQGAALALSSIPAARKAKSKGLKGDDAATGSQHEGEALRARQPGQDDLEQGEVMWEVGEASDDEDDATVHGDHGEVKDGKESGEGTIQKRGLAGIAHGEEGMGLMQHDDHDGW